jgi:hypothetical protein
MRGDEKTLEEMTEGELRECFDHVGQCVRAVLPRSSGFVVIAGVLNQRGTAQFVSNVQRADAIKWLRETADRMEARDFVQRTGPPQ